MKSYFVYSDQYDFNVWGINKLHPFDGNKFSKAWQQFTSTQQDKSGFECITPNQPITDEELAKVHRREYLASLHSSATVAQVIEVWAAKFIPNSVLQRKLITPVRFACAGTLLAAQAALKNNAMAMNFGGGYHHAFSDHGEGFCFFADAVLSIVNCRDQGLLQANDKVLMIDLDAHRGNGFEALTAKDQAIKLFDMYNFQVYPGLHPGDPDEYPYMIPLKAGMGDETYMGILKTELTKFLAEHQDARLIFYNAGNDIIDSDPLGGLKISYQGVMARDQYVIEQLSRSSIPTVIMTSGGYTQQSHRLIAELANAVVKRTK